MNEDGTVVRRAEEIATEVWRRMGRTNLADPEKLGPVPQVCFKRSAEMDGMNGLAWSDRIELNADQMGDPHAEAFLREVICHELAHVAEYRLTGVMGHGPLWHALCLAVGGKGTGRVSFPTPSAGAGSGLVMFPAVLGSAALFAWGISALHAPLWCAVAGAFAGFLFPPVCWACFCRDDRSLHWAALGFTVVETGLLSAFLFRLF